jgi:hypothetical protein
VSGLGIAQREHGVESAARLEDSGALEVLAFEKQSCPGLYV